MINVSELPGLAAQWLEEFKADPLCHPPFPDVLNIPYAAGKKSFSQTEIDDMYLYARSFFRSPFEWCPCCEAMHRNVWGCIRELEAELEKGRYLKND
jgi:hypothetical protein